MDRHELQKDGNHPAPCARFCEANAFKIALRNLQFENFRLREAICRTLQENEHLADGEDCTLIHIKRAMQSNVQAQPTAEAGEARCSRTAGAQC